MTAAPAAPAISSSTPILDRLTPAPPSLEASAKNEQKMVMISSVVILLMIAGYALLFRVTAGVEPSFGPPAQLRRFIAGAIGKIFPSDLSGYHQLLPFIFSWVALFAAIAIHELGHLLVGLLARFRPRFIQLGPIQIKPPFHVKWHRSGRIPGATGFTAMVPVNAQRLRPRALLLMLGGPAANLITAFSLAFLSPDHGLLSTWIVLMSVVLGLVNLVPFRSKAVLSDGKRILMLLRNAPQGERWLALLQLSNNTPQSAASEKLHTEFIAVATAIQDNSPDTVTAHAIAYADVLRKHDYIEAARLLEICLQYSGFAPPLTREALFADAAIFQARCRNRADLAEQWLADIPQKPLLPSGRIKAEAAVLEAKGDIQAAIAKLDQAQNLIPKSLKPEQQEQPLKSIQSWRTRLQQQLDQKNSNAEEQPTAQSAEPALGS